MPFALIMLDKSAPASLPNFASEILTILNNLWAWTASISFLNPTEKLVILAKAQKNPPAIEV